MRLIIFLFSALLAACAHQTLQKNIQRKTLQKDVDTSKVDRLFQEKINYLQSLYKVRRDPYFGRADKTEDCLSDIDIKGKAFENADHRSLTFNLKTNSDFIYGVCNPEEILYKSELIYLYCKKTSRFIEIKTFWPYKKAQPVLLDRAKECSNVAD